jgi:hypothetical protein
MTSVDLAARLNARPCGDGWQARCPAHEDARASLSIGNGDDGRTLVNCHAGCSTDAILEALKLQRHDLFSDTKVAATKKIIATYDYTDEDETVLYQVIRYEPKDFKQRRPMDLAGIRGDSGTSDAFSTCCLTCDCDFRMRSVWAIGASTASRTTSSLLRVRKTLNACGVKV